MLPWGQRCLVPPRVVFFLQEPALFGERWGQLEAARWQVAQLAEFVPQFVGVNPQLKVWRVLAMEFVCMS